MTYGPCQLADAMQLLRRFVNEPNNDFPFSHGSQLSVTGPRELTCVWFSGSLEGHGDVVGRCAHFRCDATSKPFVGPTWSDAITVVKEPNFAIGNPVLFPQTAETWLLFYVRFPPKQARLSELRVICSEDMGKNWGAGRTLSTVSGYWPRHPVVVSGARWLLPVCNIDLRPPVSFVWISDNQGHSWCERRIPESEFLIQPSLIQSAPSHWQVFLRDMHCQSIYRCHSWDGGETWTAPIPTPFPNNNSGIQALSLASEKIALAFPHQVRRDRRSDIRIAISDDAGDTWKWQRQIVTNLDVPAALAQYSYPSLARTSDNTLHLSLTYRAEQIAHYSFDEDWVTRPARDLATPIQDWRVTPAYSLRRLDLGETVYLGDKATILIDAPTWLRRCLAICPLKDATDSDLEIQIQLNRDAYIVIAYDASACARPGWLEEFMLINDTISTSRGHFKLLMRKYSSGLVRLGDKRPKNCGGLLMNYFAFITEQSNPILGNHD